MDTLFWSVLTESSVVIQLVMLLLVLMSLASWSVIFFKFVTLIKAKKRAVADFKTFQDAGDLSEAMQAIKDRRSNIFQIGYMAVRELRKLERAKLDEGVKGKLALDNVRRTLRQGVSSEMSNLGAALPLLSTCANAAPFLGLFGTVWGIMRSFHAIGLMKTASLAVVGPGIAEALSTTVVGLSVAIPAAIAYNVFVGLLGRVEIELVNFAGEFLNRMQRELGLGADSAE
ncbi:MAG: MotA/TolQ/ExbB proton channel family protein [Desulfovibrio sp.]|uniref:MotA/TolQ/ExbB proton channel family protein n=1 Tax=Desulfovibrio sp. 7SRBS1 TaxID=3378064 RepID=UPI003B406D4B